MGVVLSVRNKPPQVGHTMGEKALQGNVEFMFWGGLLHDGGNNTVLGVSLE